MVDDSPDCFARAAITKMRLGRRPGAFVAFLDAFTQETFLRLQCDEEDVDLVEFRLFDQNGEIAADSCGLRSYPEGVVIHDSRGELLLLVPAERDESIQYRIYNSEGTLITCSDGKRTQLYAGVRIDGNRQLAGRPPAKKVT